MRDERLVRTKRVQMQATRPLHLHALGALHPAKASAPGPGPPTTGTSTSTKESTDIGIPVDRDPSHEQDPHSRAQPLGNHGNARDGVVARPAVSCSGGGGGPPDVSTGRL